MVERQALEPDYESCVAFYAGTLAPAYAAGVDRWLRAHPAIAARAQRHAACERILRARFRRALYEPIPSRLQVGRGSRAVRWPQRLGVAAAIVLAATGGWWLGQRQVGGSAPPEAFGPQVAVASAVSVGAQPVADKSRGSPPAPAQQPNLSALGYSLVNRRVLAGGRQPRTEFVYRNAAGARIEIYARSRPSPSGRVPSLSTRNGVSLVRWYADGVDYALTGSLPPAALEKLARTAAGVASGRPAANQQATRPISSGSAEGDAVAPVAGDTPPATERQSMDGMQSGSGL